MTDILKDIIDALSMYSSEHLICTYLAQHPEYHSYCRTAEKKDLALQELLSPEGKKLLEEFSNARDGENYIELKANFWAGLMIGIELSRL